MDATKNEIAWNGRMRFHHIGEPNVSAPEVLDDVRRPNPVANSIINKIQLHCCLFVVDITITPNNILMGMHSIIKRIRDRFIL
jgi:hypothetical protein